MFTSQKWLLAPSAMWSTFPAYKQFEEFARSVAVINDLAERVKMLLYIFLFSYMMMCRGSVW